MATESPGWYRQSGEPIEPAARTQGRAREFCQEACRQVDGRAAQVREVLARNIALTEKQVGRQLTQCKVSIRDASVSRFGFRKSAHG